MVPKKHEHRGARGAHGGAQGNIEIGGRILRGSASWSKRGPGAKRR